MLSTMTLFYRLLNMFISCSVLSSFLSSSYWRAIQQTHYVVCSEQLHGYYSVLPLRIRGLLINVFYNLLQLPANGYAGLPDGKFAWYLTGWGIFVFNNNDARIGWKTWRYYKDYGLLLLPSNNLYRRALIFSGIKQIS